MVKRKVLYISHNHPSVRPGGAETYALELYTAMRSSDQFEPLLLARTGAPHAVGGPAHPGTPFMAVNDDPNQTLLYTDLNEIDGLLSTLGNKEAITLHYSEYLAAHRPDIVHFQHTAYLGYDIIRQTRNILPNTPLVYTLHDFLPICHRHGLMIRATDNSLCDEASPERCHRCFPAISPQQFFLRKRFIQSHLNLIDLFLAPSYCLLNKFRAWGVPPDRLQYLDYGRISPSPPPTAERPRTRLGFFGQINPFKGVDVLLKAMVILEQTSQALNAQRPVNQRRTFGHLLLHGANLEVQQATFQAEVKQLLADAGDSVTWVGPYGQEAVPRLMADIDWVVVPSIWWENSPLVIQEAFMCGRPVICSDIGGMAEKVQDGVNGLHFRAGDPVSLAQTIRRAVTTPGLWDRLRANIPAVPTIGDSVAYLSDRYQRLLAAAPRPQAARQ